MRQQPIITGAPRVSGCHGAGHISVCASTANGGGNALAKPARLGGVERDTDMGRVSAAIGLIARWIVARTSDVLGRAWIVLRFWRVPKIPSARGWVSEKVHSGVVRDGKRRTFPVLTDICAS